MAASDPIAEPLVAQGYELIAQFDALEEKRKAKAAELEPLDAELKTLAKQIEQVEQQLIAKGGGLYGEGEQTARVSMGFPKVKTPDTFILPEGAEETAREMTGTSDRFYKLFDRKVILTPKLGFDSIADALLTPAKARTLVALCLQPGGMKGGRVPSVRWK